MHSFGRLFIDGKWGRKQFSAVIYSLLIWLNGHF